MKVVLFFSLSYLGIIFLINIPILLIGMYYYKKVKNSNSENKDKIKNEVSVVVPFYNEEKNLIKTINSIVNQTHALKEILLIDDGSTDSYEKTLSYYFILKKQHDKNEYEKYPEIKEVFQIADSKIPIKWIRTENQGKCKALDLGFKLATSDLVVTIDADSIILEDAIEKIVTPFAHNKSLVTTFGSLDVLNNCEFEGEKLKKYNFPKSILEVSQFCDIVNSLIVKQFLNRFDMHFCIIGAFACYKRLDIINMGGFEGRTFTEDRDICLEIYEKSLPKKLKGVIEYVPEAICLTEVPTTINTIRKQQRRWAGGWLQTLIKYKRMIFNPRMSVLGKIMLPLLVADSLITPFIIVNIILSAVLMLSGNLPQIETYLLCLSIFWTFKYLIVGFYYLVNNPSLYTHKLHSPQRLLKVFFFYISIFPLYTTVNRSMSVLAYFSFLRGSLKWE
jgi:biofilm PGA synthesis N-glycosyltransferase PgaC